MSGNILGTVHSHIYVHIPRYCTLHWDKIFLEVTFFLFLSHLTILFFEIFEESMYSEISIFTEEKLSEIACMIKIQIWLQKIFWANVCTSVQYI